MDKTQYVEKRAEKYFFDNGNINGLSDNAFRELQQQLANAMTFSNFELTKETEKRLTMITANFFANQTQEDELVCFEECLKITPYSFFEWLTATIVESMKRGYIIGFIDSFTKEQ